MTPRQSSGIFRQINQLRSDQEAGAAAPAIRPATAYDYGCGRIADVTALLARGFADTRYQHDGAVMCA
jgi:hypothetical protein